MIGGVCGLVGTGNEFQMPANTFTSSYYLAAPGLYAVGDGISLITGLPVHGIYSGATALTDAQLRDRANFVGWDFDDIWNITTDPASYPFLRSRPPP